MKKLYLATQTVNVLFVAEEGRAYIMADAHDYLRDEARNSHEIDFIEIKKPSDIPSDWKHAPIYGIGDGDITGEEFLASQDPEYQEFIRLKAKFEPDDLPEIVKYLDNK